MQVTKFSWNRFIPALVVRDGNKLQRIELFDKDLSISLGGKHCIGFDKKPCPIYSEISNGYQCNRCRYADKFALCMPCNGTSCINTKRRGDCETEDYFIYLAAFGPILKVGISYKHRFRERLVEQGSDIGVLIASIRDGMLVRKIEQDVAKNLNITDRLRGEQKHKVMFGSANDSSIVIKKALNSLNGTMNMHPIIYDMRSYYRLDRIHSTPHLLNLKEGSKINGRVLAIKGNLIVLSTGECFNAHSIIGRDIDFTDKIDLKPTLWNS